MIKIKSPGRICLFGEHQDYLSFPVISMAISRYIYLLASKISEKKFLINLPDIDQNFEIGLNNKELEYNSNRDYIKTGNNQFIRRNIRFNHGYKIQISGDIPINAGVASSSALVIAWLYFLNLISNQKVSNQNLALMGYNSEVSEFKESGGMMDHFNASYGNIIYLKPSIQNPDLINYDLILDGFVLGDSMIKKDTVDDLRKVKEASLISIELMKQSMPGFNQFQTKVEDIIPYLPNLNKTYQEKIIGILINRDLTNEAKNLIDTNIKLLNRKNNVDKLNQFYKKLGSLMNMHQDQLREKIGVSIDKIDNMISKCKDVGAYGGKINGSGFGGTMFTLFPNNQDKLVKAIEACDGRAYIINTSKGVGTY